MAMLCLSRAALFSAVALILSSGGYVRAADYAPTVTVHYATEKVDGLDIFFRESGDPSKPAVVLLHGFPASSHQYRDVLASPLAAKYHLIAPDYPGFGDSAFPDPETFSYNFDHLAKVMDKFLQRRGISRYAIMVQDYGAPVGYRIASWHPERITAIIVQNGNAYDEGIGPKGWGPILDYWKHKTPELEKQISDAVFTPEGMKWQYTVGTRHPESILPDNWNLDYQKISRPGEQRAQLDLFYDYQNNLKLYPAWHQYLREHQPPMLIVWGKGDPFFPESGAAAYKQDVKNIDYNILDTGHFALEEEGPFIIEKMEGFLDKNLH